MIHRSHFGAAPGADKTPVLEQQMSLLEQLPVPQTFFDVNNMELLYGCTEKNHYDDVRAFSTTQAYVVSKVNAAMLHG